MNPNPAALLRAVFDVRDLRRMIGDTYFRLRIGMAALALLLPVFLSIGGRLLGEPLIRSSMSSYYHADDAILRDGFVGILCAVGIFLVLYRGFTWLEDVALTAAGAAAVLVALIPSGTSPLHGLSALAFFLCFGYVLIWRSRDTLGDELMESTANRANWVLTYKILSWVFVIGVVGTVVATWLIDRDKITFAVEAAAISTFGVYWLIKSMEIERSLAGGTKKTARITTAPYGTKDFRNQIIVRPVSTETS